MAQRFTSYALFMLPFSLHPHHQEKHGHVKVPSKGGDYDKLGSWMKTQVTQYRNAKMAKLPALSEERIKLLDELGMNWGEKRKTTPWDARYECPLAVEGECGVGSVG
jgi:hypothetical protein